MKNTLEAAGAIMLSILAVIFAGLIAIGGGSFFVLCAVPGLLYRWFPYLLGLFLGWAIAEHQGWVDLVEFM